MKKLVVLCLVVLALGAMITSCSSSSKVPCPVYGELSTQNDLNSAK